LEVLNENIENKLLIYLGKMRIKNEMTNNKHIAIKNGPVLFVAFLGTERTVFLKALCSLNRG
jgi:hypothetical protein